MSSRGIQKKEGGPDSCFDNQSSSVNLNELAKKARKIYCNFECQRRSHTMTEINLNRAQITKTLLSLCVFQVCGTLYLEAGQRPVSISAPESTRPWVNWARSLLPVVL